MRGSMMISCTPMRYTGVFVKHPEWDVEQWGDWLHEDKCWACGGKMKNIYSSSGTLMKHCFPYIASYKAFKGKEKGFSRFHLLCRACAYGYGKGVIEKDGNTYYDYYAFKEKWEPPKEEV